MRTQLAEIRKRPLSPHPRRGEVGSATVELALATPLLIALLVLVAVVVHRGVDARIRLNDAAHQAARAASLAAHSPAAAVSAAERAAADALADAGVVCRPMTVNANTTAFEPGGAVTVALACTVDHGDALLLGVPSTTLTATFTSSVDTWRSTTGGEAQ